MNQKHVTSTHSNYALIPIIKVVKWSFLLYNMLLFIAFLKFLVENPISILEAIIRLIYASGWGYLIIIGPFILMVVTIEYFMKQTNLENIPKDTTIYESITQPTLMYGSIKIISPKINLNDDKID
ncbi:MAG: hypothetical protein ACXAC6_03090 [Candidatus Hodarchaeales archaeon]